MPQFGIKGEPSNDLKEQIRQIVREEMAAHEERPDGGGIVNSDSISLLGDVR